MKPIVDALGKAIQGLLSAKTLWFGVIIAAITCIFLTLYVNNDQASGSSLLGEMGCPPQTQAVSMVSVSAPLTSTAGIAATLSLTLTQQSEVTSTAKSVVLVTIVTTQTTTSPVSLTAELPSVLAISLPANSNPIQDVLGICPFIDDHRSWIGMLTIILTLMICIGVVIWVGQQLS